MNGEKAVHFFFKNKHTMGMYNVYVYKKSLYIFSIVVLCGVERIQQHGFDLALQPTPVPQYQLEHSSTPTPTHHHYHGHREFATEFTHTPNPTPHPYPPRT